MIRDHIAHLHTTYGATYLVADSALYSADNLQKLAETQLKWITPCRQRWVRSTSRFSPRPTRRPWPPCRRAIVAALCPRPMAGSPNAGCSCDPSSVSRTPSAQWTSSGIKQSDQEVKAVQTLCRTAFACRRMPSRRSHSFVAGLQTTFLSESTVCPTPHYGKRGRPGSWSPAAQLSTILQGPWLLGSQTVGHASTSRVALSSRRTNWTRPVIAPSGTRRIQRASPGGTRVSS